MKRLAPLFFLVFLAGCTFHAVARPSGTGTPPPTAPGPAPVATLAPAPPPPAPTQAWVARPPAPVQRTPSQPVAPPAPAPYVPPVASPPPTATVVNPSPSEKQDRKRDRQFDKRSDWDKLGERWVTSGSERDVVAVGQKDGAFVALSIVVEHSALEVFGIVVEFGDGTTYSPDLRAVFRPGSTSHVFDLPGGARFVRKVTFQYGNLPSGGRAQLELWGLDAQRDDRDGRDGGGRRGRGHGYGRDKNRDRR